MTDSALENPGSTSRRALLKLWAGLIWAGLVGAVGLGLGAMLRMASSGSRGSVSRKNAPKDLGPPAKLALGEVRTHQSVALVRDGQGLFALSLVCPHLGCRPAWDAGAKRFVCPCHGSAFASDGSRLKGPANRGLTHIALKTGSSGHLVVYPSQAVDKEYRLAIKGAAS